MVWVRISPGSSRAAFLPCLALEAFRAWPCRDLSCFVVFGVFFYPWASLGRSWNVRSRWNCEAKNISKPRRL